MKHSELQVEICNRLGLHLRAAAAFANLAERYSSEVTLTRDSVCANGKSVIALVTLAAAKGTTVTISAQGDDAAEAVAALAELVEDRFGEDE